MVNLTLVWMLLIPVALSLLSVWLVPRLARSETIEVKRSLAFAAVGLVISSLILTSAFYIGKGAKTSDTEIWNGEITGKTRTHGSYVESYDCNCRTVTSGSGKNATTRTQCSTCYRDHFTVKWVCQSNIGSFTIDYKDWTSRAVYLLPDPPFYAAAKVGDPASRANTYTNYIKAVPETLFRPAQESLKQKFAGQIPTYPLEIFDHYRINRVLPVGVNVPNVPEWNAKLSDALKKLGPAKQANAAIVIAKTDDPNYFYALQDAWQNGKKNDVIVVIGAPSFPAKAAWVNIMALTTDNLFQIKLRDDILALETLTADAVVGALTENTLRSFKRKSMEDFKYLESEIDPPEWVMAVTIFLIIAAYAGFWFYIYREFRVFGGRRSVYNRSTRKKFL